MRSASFLLLMLWCIPSRAQTPAHDAASAWACRKRAPCTVAERHPGGVFKLALGRAADARCDRFEWWVTRQKLAQLLLRVCNDGYGAAGVGEDVVEVKNGRTFEHRRSGGSAWRWTRRTKVALQPPRVVEESSTGSWNLGPNAEQHTWSWERFAGVVRWTAPRCAPPKVPPRPYAYAIIPEVVVTGTWASSGWRSLSPGRCALEVDGVSTGFTLDGRASESGDARLRVLASGTVLFIEVEDDQLLSPARHGGADDHLEIWVSAQPASWATNCLEAKAVSAKRWTVRVSDGKVSSGNAGPVTVGAADLHVEHEMIRASPASAGALVRLKVRLPRSTQRLSVVYADTDDGKTIERRIATSRLWPDDAFSLGDTQQIPTDRAVCELSPEGLRPRLPSPVVAREPVIRD